MLKQLRLILHLFEIVYFLFFVTVKVQVKPYWPQTFKR